MSKISELSDGGSLVSTDFLIAVRSGGNVKVKMDTINVDQVDLGDNEFIRLGNSQDLTLVHNASNSIINQAGIGNLLIQKAGTTKASITANGLEFPDDSKAIFGAGSDLQIYHDGSHSYIKDTATGNLRIDGTDIQIRSTAGANMAAFVTGAEVQLYHNNQKKFETTVTGIDVTGSVTADGLTVNSGTANNVATFTSTDAYALIKFEDNTTAAEMTLGALADDMVFRVNASERLRIEASGNVGISTSTPQQKLEIQESSAGTGDAIIRLRGNGNNSNNTPLGSLEWFNADSSGAQPGVVAAVEAQSANANGHMGKLLFKTHDGSGSEADPPTTRMTIDQSGNVGIGTSSPDALLELSALNGTTGSNNTLRFTETDTAVAAGQQIGKIEFKSNDASGDGPLVRSYIFSGSEDTTPSSFISFATHPGGAGNTTDERMRIDSLGNLLVGRTAFTSAKLHLENATDVHMDMNSTGDNRGKIGSKVNDLYLGHSSSAANIIFKKNIVSDDHPADSGDETMRIDGSGNLLVGKTSTGAATAGIELNGANDVLRIARDGGVLQELNLIGGTAGDIIEFRKDNSAIGSIGVDGSDNMYITSSATNHVGLYLGGGGVLPMNSGSLDTSDNVDIGSPNYQFVDLYLSGTANIGLAKLTNSNTTSGYFMSIDAEGTEAGQKMTHYWYDGSYHDRFTVAGNTAETVVNQQGEDIDFRVETDATSNGFVVNAGAGIVGIGRDNAWSFGTNTTSGFAVNVTSGRLDISSDSVARITQINDATGTFDRFYRAGSIVGSITTDGTNTAFNTSSDQRLKENIVDAPSASDDIDAIQVRSFDWKANGSHQKYGMVAQELNTVAPEAVSEGETEEDMMGVDYSKLVPMLIKEIQSLRARVAQLES